MSQATYYGHLSAIAAGIDTDLGVPFLPCKLQLLAEASGSTQDDINAAIGQVWEDTGYEGADLSDIPCEPEDTVHLDTAEKTIAAGARQWSALERAFFTPAVEGGGGAGGVSRGRSVNAGGI